MTGAVVRGALAGAAAWWAMDHALRWMRGAESPVVREEEDRARGRVPALEVLADRVAGAAGADLTRGQREAGGTVAQWTVGVAMGVLVAVVRPRDPAVRWRRGLSYGAVLSLTVDEGLVPLLGLAPGPWAFPWQTHARGFLGHLVFGIAAEAVLAAVDRTREARATRRLSPSLPALVR